ncbi:MAG: ABC transporter permease subunit [Acidobacteriota bacterium]|nr:ABC transporter permease subunit [Acidobacteriota bacterium]
MNEIKVNHNQVHLAFTLGKITAHRLIKRHFTWVFLLLGCAPAMIATFWIGVQLDFWDAPKLPFALFQDLLGLYFGLFYVPLLAILLGQGVISEEVETKNLTFTLVRPLRRESIVAGRFLGHLFVGWILVGVSLVVVYMGNMMFQFENFFSELLYLIRSVIIMCFGFMGYLGIVALFGTLLKRMSIVLCIFWVLMDVFFSRLPVSKLQAVSVQYRMLASFPDGELPTQFGLAFTKITAAPMYLGFTFCLLFAATCCAVMTWRIRKEVILSGGIK